jgi:glycine oxidase
MRQYAELRGRVSGIPAGSGLLSRNVMATSVPSRKPPAEVVILGGGVIGLSVALFAVRAGLEVRVIDASLPGAASRVAAGLLAPSLGALPARSAAHFRKASEGYGRFLQVVRDASSHQELVAGQGILELALAARDVGFLNEALDPSATPLASAEIARQIPDLIPIAGAMLHPNDGWIEPRALLAALTAALPPESILRDRVTDIRRARDLEVRVESGEVIRSSRLVVSAGSWSPLLTGLPTKLPIVPARGEVILIETAHSVPVAIACEDRYVVPRPGAIVVGSTFEMVGYDPSTTANGAAALQRFATRLLPDAMARATKITSWAGLRPMTPDRVPIIDRDPNDERIVYACGHGKNGLLLAGLTAEIVLDLLGGNQLEPSSPFALSRFKIE